MLFHPFGEAGTRAGEADGDPGFHAFITAVHRVSKVAMLGIGKQLAEEMRRLKISFAQCGKVDLVFVYLVSTASFSSSVSA